MRKVILFEHISGSLGYYIDRPGKFIHDVIFSLKLAWERVLYGWDRTALWNVDAWVCENLPQMLEYLKEHKGINGEFFDRLPDGYPDESEEGCKRALAKQNECLDTIIEGFKAAGRIIGLGEDISYEQRKLQEHEDHAKFHKGMQLFDKHFFSLWS
jgi:hypothetical protein